MYMGRKDENIFWIMLILLDFKFHNQTPEFSVDIMKNGIDLNL